MKTATKPKAAAKQSRLQAFLFKHIEASPFTQKELAEKLGYPNPNMITILKQGDAKLPLDRVVAMAEVLNVDPKHLFTLALEAYFGTKAANEIVSIFAGPNAAPTAAMATQPEVEKKASG